MPLRSRALSLLLLGSLGIGACECGAKSDEELLRERVDTTKVHLYVATKYALGASDDAAAAQARAHLLAALGATGELLREDQAAPTGGPIEPRLSAALQTGADLIELTAALWRLRGVGVEIVEEKREIEPILSVLVPDPALRDALGFDVESEHALLLVSALILKLHEKNPLPIPLEFLLYEGWMCDAEQVQTPGLRTLLHAARSYVYASAELCDLAARDADALRRWSLEERRTQLGDLVHAIAPESAASAEQLAAAEASLRTIAHGATLVCYRGRDQPEQADAQLELMLEAAEDAGLPPPELALGRAYLAYKSGDLAASRAYLEIAKEASWSDDRHRERIDEVIAYLDREDESALDAYFDKAFFAAFFLRLALEEAERAGLLEALGASPLGRGLHAFALTATSSVSAARQSVPTGQDAQQAGEGLVERLRRLLP